MPTHKCSSCKQVKDISEFHKHSKSTLGHSPHCKICRSIAHKANKPLSAATRLANVQRFYANNREKINNGRRTKYSTDPVANLSQRLMTLLTWGIYKGYGIRSSLNQIVGCSYADLIIKIGPPRDGYHLGHICPRAQAKTEEEVEKLFHWKNLQWVDSKVNKKDSWLKTPAAEWNCIKILGRNWISSCNDSI